jgi:hypothetical protein
MAAVTAVKLSAAPVWSRPMDCSVPRERRPESEMSPWCTPAWTERESKVVEREREREREREEERERKKRGERESEEREVRTVNTVGNS